MVQSFNVPTDKVAKWAGLMSATFSLAQCLTGIAWGRASDRFGRKPTILLALFLTMVTGVLFGFSKSLTWAMLARAGQGLCNGNVGINVQQWQSLYQRKSCNQELSVLCRSSGLLAAYLVQRLAVPSCTPPNAFPSFARASCLPTTLSPCPMS